MKVLSWLQEMLERNMAKTAAQPLCQSYTSATITTPHGLCCFSNMMHTLSGLQWHSDAATAAACKVSGQRMLIHNVTSTAEHTAAHLEHQQHGDQPC